jgi:PHD/YefM family antitoxin component YafN of YafNO toxin-antitoxin module
MKEVTAAELRQAMGKVARRLERTGEPVLLKLGNKPVGVLVSVKDFEERFALLDAAARREELMKEILADTVRGTVEVDEVVRDLRER